MDAPGSVSIWIERLRQGDPDAAQHIWEQFVSRLLALAHKKLGHAPRRAADEEDVVQKAFDSFFRAAQAGRFPQLHDREDVWQVLACLTHRKAIDLVLRKPDARGKMRGESWFETQPGSPEDRAGLADLAAPEPSPELAAELTDLLEHLLRPLTELERQLVLLKMEGYTHPEIAGRLGLSLRAVERKWALIRDTLQKELSS